MDEGTRGHFILLKNDKDTRTHQIRLLSDTGQDLGTSHISEHDENLGTGRLLHHEMERHWQTHVEGQETHRRGS